jgi:hypothetical protein
MSHSVPMGSETLPDRAMERRLPCAAAFLPASTADQRISMVLLVVYFITSGVTWISGQDDSLMKARLTVGEYSMLLIMMWAVFMTLRDGKVILHPFMAGPICLLLYWTWNSIVATDFGRSYHEVAVHAFAFAGFLALIQCLGRMNVENVIRMGIYWSVTTAGLGMVGIGDMLAINLGMTPINPRGYEGIAIGTFRNAGQAGSYYATALLLGVPLLFVVRGRQRVLLAVAVIICTISVVLTVKRASTIGMLLGYVAVIPALIIAGRLGASLLYVMVGAIGVWIVAVLVALSAEHVTGAFAWRWGRKWSVLGDNPNPQDVAFLVETNFAALQAFADRPWLGVGLSDIGGMYTTHETHNTYMKLLATSGVVGAFIYVFMMIGFIWMIMALGQRDRRLRVFALVAIAMLLGAMVAWGYVYHLRKREFWIYAAFLTALANHIWYSRPRVVITASRESVPGRRRQRVRGQLP